MQNSDSHHHNDQNSNASDDELLRLSQELADSRRDLKNIVENAPFPIGVYYGREMKIVFANQSILDVWGKGNNVIGKLYSDVLPELSNQEVFKQLDGVFTTGVSFHARNQRIDLMVHGLLKLHYFNYSFTALRDDNGEVYGVMNTAADVSDIVLLKQEYEAMSEELVMTNEELAAANEELASSNEEMAATNEELVTTNEELNLSTIQKEVLYNELTQSRNDLLFAIDAADLGTFDLNPVTSRFVGNDLLKSWFGLQPEEEIELTKAMAAILESDRKRVEAAIHHSMEYRSGGNYDVEYTIVNPADGSSRVVRAKGKALFNEQKEPVRLSGTVQDITEQKKNEQRKNDFIGMVSHELKTPLTSLNAYIQLLEAKLKGHESFTSGALSQCRKQVSKMTTMINGFLNVSRLESSQIQIDKKPFDMADVMKEVAEEALTTITSHEIIFAPVEPTPVFADWDKIGQVVNNFISNAVKYSPNGSIINVACITTGQTVQVSVKDHGMGIKPGELDKLFDRYYRVENPNTKHISGFGIGLYLCKEIILRHDGKIFAESELGKGSVFYFTLPLRIDAA